MRYLVKARLKRGQEQPLLDALAAGTLGEGSVAGGEYQRVLLEARLLEDGTVCWVEVCYCVTPLDEETPYWEEYFDLVQVCDAHPRENCRDENGSEPWACSTCDCTAGLEEKMQGWGEPFLPALRGLTEDANRRS